MNSDRAQEGMAGLCSMMSGVSAGRLKAGTGNHQRAFFNPYFWLGLAWEVTYLTSVILHGQGSQYSLPRFKGREHRPHLWLEE